MNAGVAEDRAGGAVADRRGDDRLQGRMADRDPPRPAGLLGGLVLLQDNLAGGAVEVLDVGPAQLARPGRAERESA